MPVIINEFEVVVEAPANSNTQEGSTAEIPALSPHDIEQIVHWFSERRARLLAD